MIERVAIAEDTPFATTTQLVAPILFLIFNRPETTAQVFETIRQARPRRLYVAADGPRAARAEEVVRCAETRQIATAVDWPCEVRTLFQNENLGCRRAISGAIHWFFQHEPEGIILEDDCLPDLSFFFYTQALLTRYRDDERIMAVGAQHFHGNTHNPQHSYFFSRYNHCWGWASWRRAWKFYDHDMALWPQLRDTDWLLGIGDGSRLFQRYWTDIFDRVHSGEIDTWDYHWTFSCWVQNGLTVLPARNLVTNIGFDENATHTTNKRSHNANLPLERLDFPLIHPDSVTRDVREDRWTSRYHYRINSILMLKHIARRMSGLLGAAKR